MFESDSDWDRDWASICFEEQRILATEGKFHVNGIFFVDEADATMARMYRAEEITRKARGA